MRITEVCSCGAKIEVVSSSPEHWLVEMRKIHKKWLSRHHQCRELRGVY